MDLTLGGKVVTLKPHYYLEEIETGVCEFSFEYLDDEYIWLLGNNFNRAYY